MVAVMRFTVAAPGTIVELTIVGHVAKQAEAVVRIVDIIHAELECHGWVWARPIRFAFIVLEEGKATLAGND